MMNELMKNLTYFCHLFPAPRSRKNDPICSLYVLVQVFTTAKRQKHVKAMFRQAKDLRKELQHSANPLLSKALVI